MPSLNTWVWRLSAFTTAIYALVFLVDFGIHLHEGWSKGCMQRDRILDARRDCASIRFKSVVIQERCAQVQAAPLVVPWHVAFHHVGHHLSLKMASMLQSLVVLVLLLVPIGMGVFWCAMRSQQQHLHHHTPAQSNQLATSLAALWTHLASSATTPASASSSSSGSPARDTTPPPSPPKSCIYELPVMGRRSSKKAS